MFQSLGRVRGERELCEGDGLSIDELWGADLRENFAPQQNYVVVGRVCHIVVTLVPNNPSTYGISTSNTLMQPSPNTYGSAPVASRTGLVKVKAPFPVVF